jgi:hypothetical protein
MPKIALRYTGDDKAVQARLEATNGLQYFEPVDAREVLATPGNEYDVDDETRKLLGVYFEPRMQGLSVPQLQGDDAELQTGISADKYARSQVVKAVPEAMQPTATRPMTTTGRSLNLDEAREGVNGGEGDPRFSQQDGAGAGDNKPRSEGMTKSEMQTFLRERGVQFDSGANKDELAELVDKQR